MRRGPRASLTRRRRGRQSEEVEAFKKLRWGAEPVSVFMGLALVANDSSAAWTAHIQRVNRVLKFVLPLCCSITIASILGVRNLAGLGSGPMPVLGTPNA